MVGDVGGRGLPVVCRKACIVGLISVPGFSNFWHSVILLAKFFSRESSAVEVADLATAFGAVSPPSRYFLRNSRDILVAMPSVDWVLLSR